MRTVRFSGRSRRSIWHGVGDHDPLDVLGAREPCDLAAQERVGDVDPHLARAVLAECPRPRDQRPAVVVTSSPTMQTLSWTRPVTSVTATCSAPSRVLCMTAVGVEHLGEADGDLRAPGVRRDGDDPVAVEPKVVEVP